MYIIDSHHLFETTITLDHESEEDISFTSRVSDELPTEFTPLDADLDIENNLWITSNLTFLGK